MSKRNRSENATESAVELQRWKAEFYELMQLWAYSEQYPALMDQELAPLNRRTFSDLVRLMHTLKTEAEMRPYLDRVKRTLVSTLDKEGISYKRFQKLYTEINAGRLSAEVLKIPQARVKRGQGDTRGKESERDISHELKKFWKRVEHEEQAEASARERRNRINIKRASNNAAIGHEVFEDALLPQHVCEDPYKARVLEIHNRISRFGKLLRIWATFASIMCVGSVVMVFATYRAPEVDPLLSYAAVAAISLCTLVCVVTATAIMLTHVLRSRNGYLKFCNEERIRLGIKENDDLPYDLRSLRRSYLSLLAGRIGVGATVVLLAVAVWTGRMWYQSEWGLPATITHEMIAGLVGMVFAMFIVTVLSLDCTKVMAADGKVVASLYNSNQQDYGVKPAGPSDGMAKSPQPICAARVSENLAEGSGEWGPYIYYGPETPVDFAKVFVYDENIVKTR